MTVTRTAIVLILLSVFMTCNTNKNYISEKDFLLDQERWRERRDSSLNDPYGWLSLAGLFWLEEGNNTFGGNRSNDIVFPSDSVPQFIGKFILIEGRVKAVINEGHNVYANGNRITSLDLIPDDTSEATKLTWGPLKWYLIKRGERFGIRLKDSTSSVLMNFQGMDMFEPTREWAVQATVEKYDPPKEIFVPDILGNVNTDSSPGAAVFEVKGVQYRLDLMNSGNNGEYFLVFADKTNGHDSYGSGRFLYVPVENENGTTILDFNKAYNPPCIFTPYATCPLPPMQNRLPFEIRSGEKSTGFSDHFTY